MLMVKFYVATFRFNVKTDGRVDKANRKIFQLSFARFTSIVVCEIFYPKVLYVRKPILQSKKLLFVFPFSRYYVFSLKELSPNLGHYLKVLINLLQNVNFYFRMVKLS